MSATGDNDIEPGKVFVGGLSWETTKESLSSYFSAYGEVNDSTVMVDPTTKKPRGFGFVTFVDPSVVETVLSEPNHILDNKKIDPKQATVKPPQPKKVFVGGIAAETNEEMIRACFEPFGEVKEVDIKYDRDTSRMKGFAFVTFSDAESVKKVCDHHFHDLNNKTVEVKIAQTPSRAGFGQAANYNYQPRGPYGGQYSSGYGGQGYPQQQAQQQYRYGYGYNTGNPGSYGYGGAAQGTGYGASAGSYDQYGQSANGQQPMTNYQDSYSGYSTSRTDATGYPAQQYPPYQQQQQQPQQPQQQQQQPYGGAQAGGHSGYGRTQQTSYNGYPSVR